MVITVRHKAHLEWVPATPEMGEQPGEEVRFHANHPSARLVKRLVPGDRETVVDIPDESVERMTKDFALHHHGVNKPRRAHLHEIISRHFGEVMKNHSPSEHWTDIHVDDGELKAHLMEVFLPVEEA